ncbi:MAG: peptidoglycan bridge formation protein FemAB [Kordiimonas sp.]|nr:peptidoglycan bridge formation protein FemAB [Kordiimonas sp.]
MQVVQLDLNGDTQAWDDYVRSHGDGSFCHLSGWGRVIAKTFNHKHYYLMAIDKGDVKGVLPLTFIKSMLFGRSMVSTAFAMYGGPLADNPDVLSLLDQKAWELTQKSGAKVLEYRTKSRLHEDWACKDDVYVDFVKELDADNEVNMQAIRRKQRAMIRKGIKFGLEAVIDDNADRLYSMYAESVRNLGTPVFSKRLFVNLMDEFGRDCEVLTVLHEGRPISSVMSFYYNDAVLPYYGGGTFEARQYAANDFMYWSVMERAVTERQCREFVFGRSKLGTGAYNFKKNWGFTAISLQYEYKLADGEVIPDISPNNPKYRMMINTWQRLPLQVANSIGPMVSRYLG